MDNFDRQANYFRQNGGMRLTGPQEKRLKQKAGHQARLEDRKLRAKRRHTAPTPQSDRRAAELAWPLTPDSLPDQQREQRRQERRFWRGLLGRQGGQRSWRRKV